MKEYRRVLVIKEGQPGIVSSATKGPTWDIECTVIDASRIMDYTDIDASVFDRNYTDIQITRKALDVLDIKAIRDAAKHCSGFVTIVLDE